MALEASQEMYRLREAIHRFRTLTSSNHRADCAENKAQVLIL